VTGDPPGDLQNSNTTGPKLTSFKWLLQLDRLHIIQPRHRTDINGASS